MNSATKKQDLPAGERLKITEIFHSLQGEAVTVGIPTVFVRLTGCPLRCRYCDTEYAFFGGAWMSFDAILERVGGFGARHVCVTGGEPLAQKNCVGLLARLCDAGFAVSIETSGAFDVSVIDPRVTIVMDIKTPESGESERNRLANLPLLRAVDQLKFVICGRDDYEWARDFLAQHPTPAEVLLSPSYGQLEPVQLAEWILADKLEVRLQIQLHKLLWGEGAGH